MFVKSTKIVFSILSFLLFVVVANASANELRDSAIQKRMVYIVSDITIPFWSVMAKGIKKEAKLLGYTLDVYSADNDKKKELALTIQALHENVVALIISPTSSSASVTILKLASKALIPVVIADIGTEGGDYVSYISSDNKRGSYALGQNLAQQIEKKGGINSSVGIIAIPQKRKNGQARTQGFMQAINEAGIKSAGIKQQVTFSYQETYDFSRELINNDEDVRALWLQGSSQYQAALDAIEDAGKRQDILLFCFDSEPEFISLIPQGVIAAAAMQQPYLMGRKAVEVMHQYLQGENVPHIIELPVLPISSENIEQKLMAIKVNVLGIDE